MEDNKTKKHLRMKYKPSTRFYAPSSLLYNGYLLSCPGRGVNQPPHLVPRLKK